MTRQVGNLAWGVAWHHLKDHFKAAGEVVHADVMMEPGSGRSKGCARADELQLASPPPHTPTPTTPPHPRCGSLGLGLARLRRQT